jgi:hypothetical protein
VGRRIQKGKEQDDLGLLDSQMLMSTLTSLL